MRLDLNADIGESFGAYNLGHDALLMPAITSASVACGFHAGDPGVMRETIALARQHGVAIGAHPGFPDLVGFGRREMRATPREVEDFVVYQIGALAAMAAAQGLRLQHVKAHGALYNIAVRDAVVADAIARATASVDSALILFGLPGSELIAAGRRAGLRTAREGFADRAYRADGTLVPRAEPGAVIDDPDIVVSRAIAMVREREVRAIDGSRVALEVETICVHGDTPGAAMLASRIRQALLDAGVSVLPVGESSSVS
jgi:5-oxoprolinase (ATP-hydrolysing) subunit A